MSSVATLPQQQEQEQSQAQTEGESKIGLGDQDPLREFRELAQQVQKLQGKYPEIAESSVAILKEIKKSMTLVAGNAQRTQEKQAPPV